MRKALNRLGKPKSDIQSLVHSTAALGPATSNRYEIGYFGGRATVCGRESGLIRIARRLSEDPLQRVIYPLQHLRMWAFIVLAFTLLASTIRTLAFCDNSRTRRFPRQTSLRNFATRDPRYLYMLPRTRSGRTVPPSKRSLHFSV